MKNKKIFKHIGKILALSLGLGLVLSPLVKAQKSEAVSEEESLESDIRTRLDQVGGDWQVAIKTLDGDKNLDLYFTSESNPQSLPAASSIKTFIGLATFDLVERSALEETDQVKSDVYAMLNASDNEASNRLVSALGGFDKVNRTIIDITGGTKTSLKRLFLHKGPENMANARDLNLAMERIYRKDFANEEHSFYIFDALTKTTTRSQKLLGNLPSYSWAINKSGELPDRGVENDSAIVKVNDRVYAITVMTRTKNIQNRKPQLDAMKDVGRIAYDYYAGGETTKPTNPDNEEKENQNPIFSENNIYTYKKIDLDRSLIRK